MRRHLAGASYLFVADVAVRALNFVAMAWIARTLAPELYGMVIIGASILDYALLLSDWGLKTLGTRETARGDERRFQPRQVIAARIVLGSAVFIIANVLIALLPLSSLQAIFIHVYLIGLLPYILHVDWYHQGHGNFVVITVARTLGSICLLVGAFALVHSPSDASVVPWLYVTSVTATTIAMLVAVRSRRELMPTVGDFKTTKALFGVSTALGVAALCGQTFMVLPPIVAGQSQG
ncbi:MAG: oligosaccharide flippase family protein, partial [bacterium]|nr:oligosaccharide flippase family protein [Candidatus Kapabacteria bacterium]